MAESYFKFDVTPTINLIDSTIENEKAAKESLAAKATEFNKSLNLIKLGVNTADTYSDMLTALTGGATDGTFSEDSLIGQLSSTLSSMEDVVKLGVSLMPPVDQNGNAMDAAAMLETVGLSTSVITEHATSLGQELARALSGGMDEELGASKAEVIAKLSNWLNEINQAVLKGQIIGNAVGGLQIKLADLDHMSFDAVIQAYKETREEVSESFGDLAVEEAAALNAQATQLETCLEIDKERYGLDSEITQKTQAQAQAARELADSYSAAATQASYMADMDDPLRAETIAAFREKLASAVDVGLFSQGVDFWAQMFQYDDSVATEQGIKQVAQEMSDLFNNIIYEQMKKEDKESVLAAEDVLHFSDFDLLGDDVIKQMFESLKQAIGEENALEVMNQLGIDMTNTLKSGMESNQSATDSAATTLANGATSAFSGADWYGTGRNAAQAIANGFSSVSMPTVSLGTSMAIPKFNFKTQSFTPAADGGLFDHGQAFIAREAGAEMVGQIGRKTAVANNDQIVDSVSSGVASANREQNELLRQQNAYLKAIAAKEWKLAPTAAAGRWVKQSEEARLRAEGG